MDSINSWINEEEVRKLAEDLTASPAVVKEWEDDKFDGFAIPERQGKRAEDKNEETETELPQEVAEEVKSKRSDSLAGASAMATSAGLIGATKDLKVATDPVKESVEKTAEVEAFPPLCDHCLNEVPVNVDENAKRASQVVLPAVHPEKGFETFKEIDNQLTKTVRANGICVIDRDGDVLYSSMENQKMVAFVIDSMIDTKLMRTQVGEFGNIRLKISAKEYLEFVSVKSTRGVLVLAVSMDHVLGDTNARYVAGDVLKIANLV